MPMNEIKWGGPVPLGPSDILRGRDRDMKNLVNKVRNVDVLEITAPSGVGKSSFIAAGLIPQLRLAGMQVRPARRDWSWSYVLTAYDRISQGEADAELLYRLCLGWQSESDSRPISDHFTELAESGRPVVVLDQFEELIRYRERLGKAFLTFIGKTAADLGVTHIVAGRSEYRDQLRPMEEASGSFFHWALPEISDTDAVDDIIRSPVVAAGVDIDNEVVERLRAWWLLARLDGLPGSMGAAVGRADVGLLHLQGTLWLFKLWLLRHAPNSAIITSEHLENFAQEYAFGADDESGARLYRTGLVEYVRQHCAGIHEPAEGSEHWSPGFRAGRGAWTNGPRLMAARSAHLFSVLGYKVAQSRSGMLQTVLAEDLSPAAARAVAGAAARTDSEDWIAGVARMEGLVAGVQGMGRARDWSAEEVLEELLSAAVQAWSAAAGRANILRRFVRKGDEVYELVHDGMGAALQEWASEELNEPRAVVGVITPRTGRSFDVPVARETFIPPEVGVVPHYWDGVASVKVEGNRRIVVSGLGWDASVVMSPMSDVILEDWSLTGAFFLGSNIRDVTFRRCNMRGAAFRNVTMDRVRFEGCDLSGAAWQECDLSDVEFVNESEPKGDVASNLDLLSFRNCVASGNGVAFSALRDTVGLIFHGAAGGPWAIEGSGVRHVAIHAETDSIFRLLKGDYGHITVEPTELVVQADSEAVITYSGVTFGPIKFQ